MSAYPPIFDTIEAEAERAALAQVVKVKCCVTACAKMPTHVVSLAMKDGKRNVYALCGRHMKALRARVEKIDDSYEEQAVFYFNGCPRMRI